MQPSARIALATLLLGAATYLHGLGSLHIMSNGDEMIYAQITRATAANGHWLPLRSEMPDMVNTKPPLLFWQGIVTTDWARHWTLVALRWPSVAWTLLTATLTGLIAWRAKGRDAAAGLFAAAIYMAFLSTYRYGRPFLTNAPETFWVVLCFFVMLWWRPRSFESRFLFPTIVGGIAGVALLTKSFAQLLPIGVGLAAWHLHDARLAGGGRDWRRFFLRSVPGLLWMAILSLGIFGLWFLLDPDPRAIWNEFVVGENIGKIRANRESYLGSLLWGRMSIWIYAGSWFTNVGLLAFPFAGTLLRGWQHRREADETERLLWLWVASYFLVFCLPTQRSGRYLLEAMPAIAVLMTLHWRRLLPSALATTVAAAALMLAIVAWLSWMLERETGSEIFSRWHWGILAAAAVVVSAPLFRGRPLAACTVPAAFCGLLAVSSFLGAFDPPWGGFSPESVAAARGRVVWAPESFRGSAEVYRFVLPGATVRGYPREAGGPEPASVGADDLLIVVRHLAEPPPAGAIGSRIDLVSRQTTRQLLEMLAGKVQENLFCREWLVR